MSDHVFAEMLLGPDGRRVRATAAPESRFVVRSVEGFNTRVQARASGPAPIGSFVVLDTAYNYALCAEYPIEMFAHGTNQLQRRCLELAEAKCAELNAKHT